MSVIYRYIAEYIWSHGNDIRITLASLSWGRRSGGSTGAEVEADEQDDGARDRDRRGEGG